MGDKPEQVERSATPHPRGKEKVMAETPTHFLDSTGQVTEVAPEDATAVGQLGWQPASEQQIEDYKKQEKYGGTGQSAIAGAEALAGGLTFNLSTLAETKLLGIKPEDIQGREEASPGIHTALTALGIGIPIAATLGGAAAGGAAGQP